MMNEDNIIFNIQQWERTLQSDLTRFVDVQHHAMLKQTITELCKAYHAKGELEGKRKGLQALTEYVESESSHE